MPCTKPPNPVRSVTTPSNLPVKAPGREGRRITGYHIFSKDLLKTPTRIGEDNSAIREIILNFPRKRKLSADCRALRTVPRTGVPRKRRRFDTASSPGCPSLAAASGQGHHVVPNQQAKSPRATQAPEGSKRRRWARLAPEEGGTGHADDQS
jgi:hypothetical protein